MLALQALAVFAALATTVSAQDDETTTTGPSPTATTSRSSRTSTSSSSAGPATVTIAVGANGHVFTPNEAKANVGDTIRFNFYPGGHRVVRAEFAWPCIPYEYANINKQGFDSGTVSPQVVSNNPPSFEVRINDTAPLFFYCAAPHSCVDYHMIGVINPNATQSFAAQMAYAENVTYQLAPGEPFPSETPTALPRPTSTSDPTTSGGGGDGGDGDGGGGGGLSTGAIAGIAIGAAAVLIIAAALIYLCGRRGGFEKAYRKSGLPGSGGFGGGGVVGAGAGAGSPQMVEANYANAPGGVGFGFGGTTPKSPGQTTMSTFAGHDNGTLRSSGYFPGTTPSPGPVPGYGLGQPHGYGHGGDGIHGSPHSSPRAEHYTPFLHPPPVELPTGDHAPVPTQSPPPGYQGRESWTPGQEGQYRPGGK